MPMFTVVETFTNAPVNLMSGIADMLITEQGGNRMLYAASRAGGGVLAFDIDAGMVLADTLSFNISTQLPVEPTLDLIEANGLPYLVVSGSNRATLLSYRIEGAGTLGRSFQPAGGPVGVISAQSVVEVNGTQYLYAARSNDGSVCAYRMAADGTLTQLQDLSLGSDLQGVNIAEMTELRAGAGRFLAVASLGSDQISLLRVASNGTLSVAGSLGAAQGLGIADPSGLQAITLQGQTYLLVASGGSSSLSVIRVDASGAMTVADQLIDTLDTRMQGLHCVAATVTGGRAFILTGGADGGVELFTMLSDGHLVSVAQQLQLPGLALDDINTIVLNVAGNALEAFVAGEGTGITRLSLDLAQFATPILGGAGADTLTGGALADLIEGGAGNDLLRGNAGDDILSDGDGQDQLSGGAGADLFVLGADGRSDVIVDFQPGIDRLDLSLWGMLLDTSAVTITPMSWGARLSYGDEILDIRSANGLPLSAAQILAADPFSMWHGSTVVANATSVIGSDQDDFLAGSGSRACSYSGLCGDDTLSGRSVIESFDGGEGRDCVTYCDATSGLRADLQTPSSNTGFAAGDSFVSIEDLSGSAYSDTLAGDAGANRLWGGAGNDNLYSRDGNDSLYGGEGNDTLTGGAGADRLDGGAGARDRAQYSDATVGLRADLQSANTNTGFAAGDSYVGIEDLCGSAFADTLLGNAGANMIWGVDGDDVLIGRNGDDTLSGGAGNDRLIGGAGADLLDGSTGAHDRAEYGDATVGLRADLQSPGANTGFAAGDRYVGIEDLCGSGFADTLLGNAGANIIWGGAGSDALYGRDGADTLYGGDGNDVLGGGVGADRLDGGAGTRDRAVYNDAGAGLRADLQASGTNTGIAAGDTYVGIEDLSGSAYGDTLAGDMLANMLWGGAGNDLLFSRDGADTLYGGEGDDTLTGGAGADWLDGGAGAHDRAQYTDATSGVRADLQAPGNNSGYAAGDRYVGIEDLNGSNFADTLLGDGGANAIWGGAGDDRLYGRLGADTIYGGSGNDILIGNEGNDVLVGGAGKDCFDFDRALGASNVDRIADFVAADDTIRLDDAVFSAMTAGALSSRAFGIGSTATSAAQRILYNPTSGQIFYDADGSGSGAAVLFATVAPGTALSAADFVVI